MTATNLLTSVSCSLSYESRASHKSSYKYLALAGMSNRRPICGCSRRICAIAPCIPGSIPNTQSILVAVGIAIRLRCGRVAQHVGHLLLNPARDHLRLVHQTPEPRIGLLRIVRRRLNLAFGGALLPDDQLGN